MKLPFALVSGILALGGAAADPLTGINIGSGDFPRIAAWTSWTGRPPDIIGDIFFARTWEEFAGDVPGAGIDYSLNLHRPPPGAPPNPYAAVQMELSLPLFPNQDSDETFFSSIPDRLERGANGDYDIHWRRLAEKFVARGLGSAWIRPGWEMNIPDPLTQGWDNGGWLIGNSGVAKHQAYAAYWRRLRAAMMSVPGAQFKWTFCMLAGIETLESAQRVMDHAYPGDTHVDFISADFYDASNHARYFRGNWQRFGERWQDQVSMPERDDRTWEELAHGWRRSTGRDGAFIAEIPSLDFIRQFARERGKPFMISEWGLKQSDRALPSLDRPDDPVDGGNDNPEFVARVAAWARESDVFAIVYFDFWLARQNPFYGESRTNYVDSALMDGYWNTSPAGGSIHPAARPSPRAAAAYLTAFHQAPAGGIPAPWTNEGWRADAPVFESADDGLTAIEREDARGTAWSALPGGGFASTAGGSLLDAATLARGGASTFLVRADVKAPASGGWSGLRFLVSPGGSGGYAFEAQCGGNGRPLRWRLRRNGTTVWISERPPLLSELAEIDWRAAPVAMAVRVRPGPEGSRRIEMFFGADTAGHFNDPSPPAIGATHEFGVITDRAGATASALACHETLIEEDFDDGHAGGFTGGGWVEKRLHYRAEPGAGEKQALAGRETDRHYRVRTKIGITTPGSGGVTVLADAAGGGYRVELVSIDRPDARDILQRLILRRLDGGGAEIGSWTPSGDYFLGAFHDLEVSADALPGGDLLLEAGFNGRTVIRAIEAGQGGRSGRFGPWAAAGSHVSIDDFAALPLAAHGPEGESFAEWAGRRFNGESDPLVIGPDRDPDGDGMSNRDEHLTGTDPADPAAVWRLRQGTDGIWRAATLPGRRYRREASESLAPGSWEPWGDWIRGDGTPLEIPGVVDRPKRFFRLRAEWESP